MTTFSALLIRCVCLSPRSTGLRCPQCASIAHPDIGTGSLFVLPRLLGERSSKPRSRGDALCSSPRGHRPLLHELHFLPGSDLQGADLLLVPLGFAHTPRCLLVLPPRIFLVAASGSFLPLNFLLPPLHRRPVLSVTPFHLPAT